MPGQVADIRFPLGGISKRMGYQYQEPFSYMDGDNVRAEDVFEKRLRGGSRPAIAKAFQTLLGSGNHINLADSVRTGQEVAQQSMADDTFPDAALGAHWSLWTPGTPSDTPALPTVSGGEAYLPSSGANDDHASAIRDNIAYDATAPITLEAKLWSSDNHTNFRSTTTNTSGQRWRLALGLVNETDYANGVIVQFADANAPGRFDIAVYNKGVTLLSAQVPSVTGNVCRLIFYADGSMQIFLGSATNLVYTVTGIDVDGTRIGFGMWHPSGATRNAGFEYVNFSYTPAAAAEPIAEPALVAASNHILYYESTNGSMASVDSPTPQLVDLASDRLLVSAERFGKLYIADYGVRAEGIDGALSGTGTTFDSATYAEWESQNIDMEGDAIELFAGGTGTYTPGVYAITAINTLAPNTLTIGDAGDAGAGSIKFRIVRALKVFDHRIAGTGKLVKLARKAGTTVGPPLGCTLAAIWQDRLVLSGDPENPGDTFMSEQGDPTNWQEDDKVTSPVFGEFDTNTRIDEPVRALIPFTRDYLVFGAIDSIHVLRGNPITGGIVESVSRAVGVLDKKAWCITPDNILVVMTGDGLYGIGPDASSAEPISREYLPQVFLSLDSVNNDIQLAFDVERNGILIAVTPMGGGVGLFYWLDWTTKRFHPQSFTNIHHPTAMTVYTRANESTPTLILGGRDGYLREFRESAEDDDGVPLLSNVLIGPIQLGGDGYFSGAIREVIGQMSTLGASVLCQIQTGDSIESAYNATPRASYLFRPGKSLSWYPRLRGNACFVRLSVTGRWAYEMMTVVRERLGKQRLFA